MTLGLAGSLRRLMERVQRAIAPLLYHRLRRRIERHGLFDPDWYRATYPEVAEGGWDPIIHYLVTGWRKGYRPHLLFDPDWYQRQAGAERGNCIPPVDYLKGGARLGLSPSPYLSAEETGGGIIVLKPLGELAGGAASSLPWSPVIDRDWYLENNPDVAAAGFDPALHYILSGGREGRSPGPAFDASWYLRTHPDVRDGGFEPLDHFLRIGAAEGRHPHRSFDLDWYVAEHASEGVRRETALTFYAGQGRELWHGTHPTLPPPGSPVALWADLPWTHEPAAEDRPPATRRAIALLPDIGGPPDEIRRILTVIASLPDLDLHVCALDGAMEPLRGAAWLRLPREDGQTTRHRLTRVLQAARLTGQKQLALVMAEADPGLTALCRASGIPGRPLDLFQGLSAEAMAARIEELIGPALGRMPSVSAIVPNFNHARFLDERLGSILAQRLRPAEIIFLDDASSDDSVAVAREWQQRSRLPFTILANEINSGSPFAQWAKGIAGARGDLVWIAESDDSADPHLLERLVPHFVDPEVVLAYADSTVIGPAGEIQALSYRFYTDDIDPRRWERPYVSDGVDELHAAIAIKNTIPNASAVLFRRSALLEIAEDLAGFRYAGDWWAYAQILRRGRLAYCPEPLNLHRQHAGSATPQGERSLEAVKEALRVRLSLCQNSAIGRQTILRGLVQAIYEYEARTLRHGLERRSFVDEVELSEQLGVLSRLPRLETSPDEAAMLERWAVSLASQEAGLTSTERDGLAAKVIETTLALLRIYGAVSAEPQSGNKATATFSIT